MSTVTKNRSHESAGSGVTSEPEEANKGRTRRIGGDERVGRITRIGARNVLDFGVGVGIGRVGRRRHSIRKDDKP